MSEKIRPNDRAAMVRGRVREAVRLARNARGRDRQVIVYYRYLFTDTKRYLSHVRNSRLNITQTVLRSIYLQ